MGIAVVDGVANRILVVGAEQGHDHVFESEPGELAPMKLRILLQELHDEPIHRGQPLAGDAGQPRRLDRSQDLGKVGFEAADGERAHRIVFGVFEETKQRVRRDLPRIVVGALFQLLPRTVEPGTAGFADHGFVSPNLAGDPGASQGHVAGVVAKDLAGEDRKRLGDGAAEDPEIAPRPPSHVDGGPVADFGRRAGSLENVEAAGEEPEHLGVMGGFGELVDPLEASPQSPAKLGVFEDVEQGLPGPSVVFGVHLEHHVAEAQARRGVRRRHQGLPRCAPSRPLLIRALAPHVGFRDGRAQF
ncbi:MAG: hypothetical protein AAFZ38_12060 [Myxococcota bacterium]